VITVVLKPRAHTDLLYRAIVRQRSLRAPGSTGSSTARAYASSAGQDVTRLQHAAQEIHRLIEAGDPAAIDRLETFHQQYGRDALLALPSLTGGSLPIKN
jgi:hypothetical protein